MYADRNYVAGQEIYWSYNEKPNMELLYSYGFVLDKNLDEWVTIDMVFGDGFPPKLCKSIPITNGCKYNIRPYEIDPLMFQMMRAFVIKANEFPDPLIPDFIDFYKTLPEHSEEKVESKASFEQAFFRYRNIIRDTIVMTRNKMMFRDLKRIHSPETKQERSLSQKWSLA